VPLAMFLKIKDDELASSAIAEARLTHFHPLAGDVSAAVVRLCRALIRGQEWSEALHFASIQRLPETCEALNPRIRFDSEPNGFAPNVLAAAIRFVDQARNFRTALSNSISVDPGTNYVPVLVGSIGGARWGRSAIPSQTLKHHSDLIPKIESSYHALSVYASID
jgi:ADP-ribosylglycohydrolase